MFVFVGVVSGTIAVMRRHDRARIFVWLGVWSAMYGTARLVQSPLMLAAAPREWTGAARLVGIGVTYAIVVPALLVFLELARGKFRAVVLAAAWMGVAIAIAGVSVFVATGSSQALIPYNNLLAAAMLVTLVTAASLPRLASQYLVFHDRGVLVFGTLGFAVEALYSNLARPLGLPRAPIVDDVGFALLLFSLAYVALELVVSNERRLLAVEHELDVARTIQHSILPAGTPSTRQLQISASYHPMTAVAGDFYEFVEADGARLGILVADAPGHGVPAALIASMIKVAMQAAASCADDPGAVLAGLNRVLSPQARNQLISAAYLWIDTERKTARYAAAGHPPLIRVRHGKLERIECNGFLLGMVDGCAYPVRTLDITPSDRFLMYTDGLIDVENAAGEFFGDRCLEEIMLAGRSRSPDGISSDVLASIERWRPRSVPQQDDITVLVIDVE